AIDHGLHALNTSHGGTVYADLPRDLPDALQHRHPPERGLRHAINVLPGTTLAALYGEGEGGVNSEHRRAAHDGGRPHGGRGGRRAVGGGGGGRGGGGGGRGGGEGGGPGGGGGAPGPGRRPGAGPPGCPAAWGPPAPADGPRAAARPTARHESYALTSRQRR